MSVSEPQLGRLLRSVTKPARYSGHEWNSIAKVWSEGRLRLALAYPDVYEVGMSNLGLAILYDLLNAEDDLLAERVFCPWPDMEAALRQAHIPLYSLESRRPLREFDMIGFSLQFELNYSNVLTMLDLADIPLLSVMRLDAADQPLVIAGGSCAYNPEPMADFIDLFVIGEGEEVALELARLCLEVRHDTGGRGRWKEVYLRQAASLPGVYVPSLYEVSYAPGGEVACVAPLRPDVPPLVRKRIVTPLPPPPVRPVVPFVEAVHDRAMIEVMRGCKRGCRFCQAGMVYRPVRERTVEEVLAAAEELLDHTGYEEIALVSLSSTDHTCIKDMVLGLNERFDRQRVSVSLPSLRMDAFSLELATMVRRVRQTGLTFAPEAGSERLRRVINKGVTEADVLRTAEAAYASGWQRIKLYFMLGLPTETMDDVLAIAELVRSVREVGRRVRGGRVQVSVSANTFVPKPHTPFQWAAMADSGVIRERQKVLRGELPGRAVKLSWSDEDETWLEGALSRGDRRLGGAILAAWRLGARFDAWDEHFRADLWKEAFSACGLRAEFYTSRERAHDEVLPWNHINSGVSTGFLWKEWQRSLRGEPSLDCTQGCLACGVREFYSLDVCPQTVEPSVPGDQAELLGLP